MLERHGSVTVGKNLWEAYMRLERLEHSALIALQANAVQPVVPLTDSQIQKLATLRRNVFAQRGRDVCAECNACMVSEKHSSRIGS
jgi:L-fuculose-phosphate aldolase